ncbi:MAG: metallophosphoesterase [Lachnospiraceae bacterium]|nr:metallophosphoesterase [Lachnospiraceae bacterium]
MKILHCADIHLESQLRTHFDEEKAKERRNEILTTFGRMADYAKENGIGHIIIAGDLFDVKRISVAAANFVKRVIKDHQEILFYYLKGNHDPELFREDEERPENLLIFGEEWTAYCLSKNDRRSVMLYGREMGDYDASLFEGFTAEAGDLNIVTLHGTVTDGRSDTKHGIIGLNDVMNRFIDYLALGHIHARKEGRIDFRGTYVYPGCLEGRGFDEFGEHGFYVLDINEETGEYTKEFVPFASRVLHELTVDITDCADTADICARIREKLRSGDIGSGDCVRVVLKGEVDADSEKNTDLIEKQFNGMYYYFAVKDDSGYKTDYTVFQYDKSLKGEYVRLVRDDCTMSPEEKAEVVRIGLRALAGGEVWS